MTKVFWRDAPLSDDEDGLLQALMQAHLRAVYRDNVSSVTVRNVMAGSLDYNKAIACALLTLGGVHAPIEATVDLLQHQAPSYHAMVLLKRGDKVPGWGNGFVRGEHDPMWSDVHEKLDHLAPDLMGKLSLVTSAFHAAGKEIFPNPSAYTAACAIVLGVPKGVAPYLFVQGRLAGWTALAMEYLKER